MEPASFEQPFDHELDIERNGVGRESVAVDLVETFHYLLGADVHRIETYEHQDREYVVTECSVERENSVDSVLTVWRNARDLDLEEEREWVADELEREQFDQMYINSESAVPGAEPVEVTFKTRMEAANDGAE
jgi:adenine-specific DNA-methyltransferase